MSKLLVKRIVEEYCDPLLAASGFVRSSMTWNRRMPDDLRQVLDLQLGKESGETRASFTLNLGVFAPGVYQTCWGKSIEGFVAESECIARIRVGQIQDLDNLAAAKDHWWQTDEHSSLIEIGTAVTDAIVKLGLPFLNQTTSLPQIHDFLLKTYAGINFPASLLYLIIVKAQLGDVRGASNLLKEFSQPQLKAWDSRVSQVSSKLGLGRRPISTE